MRYWRERGTRIILMMDANENVWSGDLAQQLRQEGLDMEEAVHSHKCQVDRDQRHGLGGQS